MPMGCDIARWTPPGADTLDELSPILSPLAPVRQHVTAITNLELRNAYPGTHATSNAAFLSAARAKLTESTDYYLGTTVDQIAARQIGQETQLPSLEMSMDLLSTVGQCDNGYACVYQNNLSWSSPTTPLPVRGPPADRLRAPLRRGRDRRRPPRRAEEAGQPARLGHRGDLPPEEPARPGGSRPGRPVPGDRPRGRAADPEGRGRREGQRPARPRPARRRAGLLRRPRPADVRPPGAGPPGGRHPRHHLPARPRDQHAGPIPRSASPTRTTRSRTTATTPTRSPRWPRSTSSTSRCSPSSSRS